MAILDFKKAIFEGIIIFFYITTRIFNITYHSMPSQPFVTKKPNSISGTSCLRDLVLTVPPAVSLGETVTLNCSYHLQGENLYAIKLYKGRNEFMTYAAERQPPLRSFPLKGIHIGVRKSKFYPIRI